MTTHATASTTVSAAGDLLRAARALITETETSWTKQAYMRDKNGSPTDRLDRAVCFCVLGAADAVRIRTGASIDTYAAAGVLLDRAAGTSLVTDTNDTAPHVGRVVALLTRAAALADQAGDS